MKHTLRLLPLLSLMIGCSAVRPQKMVTTCENRSKQEIMTRLSSLVIGEKMKITTINDYIGLIEATRTESGNVTYSWQFIVQPGSIDAYARYTDNDGMSVDIEDDPPQRLKWYWNVRRGVEDLCGEKVRFITGKD
jgi:hypothetical protein